LKRFIRDMVRIVAWICSFMSMAHYMFGMAYALFRFIRAAAQRL
jgi:hypothetical protein